jgi:hypothetical protein
MEPDVHAQQRVVAGERTVKEAAYASELMVCNQACVSYLEGQGMTQDEIIEMLRASCDKDRVDPEQNGFWVIVTEELEAFAKLVAERERERLTDAAMKAAEKAVDLAIALEREACAKLLETTDLGGLKDNPAMQSWVAEMLLAYVKAIRARGQA